MQEAIQETIQKFADQLKSIAGDNVKSVAIMIIGNHSLIDPNAQVFTDLSGLSNITYQTKTINSPLHTEITIIIQ